MPNVSYRIKQDKTKLQKQKATVTSIAVDSVKFLFACAIARLTVMLARVIFRLCWGFVRVLTRARATARVSGHELNVEKRNICMWRKQPYLPCCNSVRKGCSAT